jgi:hypothetical protein
MCVNPAAPTGGTAPSESSGNAAAPSPDRLLLLTRLEEPAFGLHVLDLSIALDNLVRLVADAAAAYRER